MTLIDGMVWLCAGVSGAGLVYGLLLRRDYARDRRIVRGMPLPDSDFLEITVRDLQRETIRVVKQLLIFSAFAYSIWARPVLADGADLQVFGYRSGVLIVISLLLSFNSRHDLKFRDTFRRKRRVSGRFPA